MSPLDKTHASQVLIIHRLMSLVKNVRAGARGCARGSHLQAGARKSELLGLYSFTMIFGSVWSDHWTYRTGPGGIVEW